MGISPIQLAPKTAVEILLAAQTCSGNLRIRLRRSREGHSLGSDLFSRRCQLCMILETNP